MWWLRSRSTQIKQWLCFDIDDTVCDFVGACYTKLNAHYGKDLKLADHTGYWVNEHFGLKGDEFHEIAEHLRLHHELVPIEGLVDAMLKLSYYFKIQFNTHRGGMRNPRTVTTEWLNEHRFPMDSLIILKHGEPKHEQFRHRTKLFVEDNAVNALAAAESGKCDQVWLIDKPWNQEVHHWRIVRIQHDQLVPMLIQYYLPKKMQQMWAGPVVTPVFNKTSHADLTALSRATSGFDVGMQAHQAADGSLDIMSFNVINKENPDG